MNLHATPAARSLTTLVCALGLSMSAQADVVELAKYTFNGRPPSLLPTAPVNADWATSSIVMSSGLGSAPLANYLPILATTGTTEANVLRDSRYFQFTVTPSIDQALDLAQLSFQAAGASSNAVGGYAVYYSLGTSEFTRFPGDMPFPVSGANNLAGGTQIINLENEGTIFQDLTAAVTFRFYAWENTPVKDSLIYDQLWHPRPG